MLVNPGPLRTDMRRAAMPGEDPTTLRTPEELAPHILNLALPSWNETGKIWDFPQRQSADAADAGVGSVNGRRGEE